ncbi:hypothetical protein L596_006334 [Steinernema carpocapsae]|uniref:Uncharacterized protein n=1 Tax=Steinernema carpocapsae TaxID=34508 RepID=A0A4U8V202_STECR|nr:hypothetical protein L596_006334 [Steinernema carpocapsae]
MRHVLLFDLQNCLCRGMWNKPKTIRKLNTVLFIAVLPFKNDHHCNCCLQPAQPASGAFGVKTILTMSKSKPKMIRRPAPAYYSCCLTDKNRRSLHITA